MHVLVEITLTNYIVMEQTHITAPEKSNNLAARSLQNHFFTNVGLHDAYVLMRYKTECCCSSSTIRKISWRNRTKTIAEEFLTGAKFIPWRQILPTKRVNFLN